MDELASAESDPFAPAHAWMATTLVGKLRNNLISLSETDRNQLNGYLEEASRWDSIEPALLTLYSTICLQAKSYDKALQIAKQAAENVPELNLPYAQLCRIIGPNTTKNSSGHPRRPKKPLRQAQ